MSKPPAAHRFACLFPLVLLLHAALIAGCSFSTDLDTDYVQSCESDADCPMGQSCSEAGYCYNSGDVVLDVDVEDQDSSELPVDAMDADLDVVPDSDMADMDMADMDMVDPCTVEMCADGDSCCICNDGDICGDSLSCCPTADGRACTDVTTNNNNCGGCGIACEPGQICSGGLCACPVAEGGEPEICDAAAGESCCPDLGCRNTLNSTSHCGACNNTCNPGETCTDGSCACGAGAGCNEGTVCCNGSCCGSGELCCDGMCLPADDPSCDCGPEGPCPANEFCCVSGNEFACSNLGSDAENCGGCGQSCAQNQLCSGSVCECEPGFSDCDGDPSNGCETMSGSDPDNCGACGTACDSSQMCVNGACVCTNGEPIGTVNNCGFCGNACAANQTCCNGSCINLSNDEMNCGACGQTCASSEACCAGGCVDVQATSDNCGFCGNSCDPGQGCCSGVCESLTNDTNNCGACGVVCGAGESCCSGTCRDIQSNTNHCGFCGNTCGPGQSCCDGQCRSLGTDPTNCGSCGTSCPSANNATAACNSGTCDIACNAGFRDCDNSTANGCESQLASDINNCGACGNACSSANGTASCSSGSCSITCDPGYADCDGNPANGCEVNTNTSTAHCGGCNSSCSDNNGTASCMAGSCDITCNANFVDCDMNVANGCEVDTLSDSLNCGTCGNTCGGGLTCNTGICSSPGCNPGETDCSGTCYDLTSDPNHCGSCSIDCEAHTGVASATCSSGSCNYNCASGFDDCTSSIGCETNIAADPNSCGACGNVCNSTNGTAGCSSGTCTIMCSSGFGNCDNNAGNGCETNTNTSTTHCGSCGTSCSSNNGTASCDFGSCAITCDPGYANCDNNVGNGCESNIGNDASNCGACGNTCSSNNGTATCNSSTCGIVCDPGWADCDNNVGNGCETSLNTTTNCQSCGVSCSGNETCCASGCSKLNQDIDNCGACGNSCAAINGTASCSSGACDITCNPGFGNCDGDPTNGCEVNLDTSTSHCGACNNLCSSNNAAASCNTGTCSLSCDPGFGNCDGLASNGCETDLDTDANNCGACGNACGFGQTCSNSMCVCDTDFADCNGLPGDGCEANLLADSNNCGTCGTICGSGLVCADGMCQACSACGDTCCPSSGNCLELAATCYYVASLNANTTKTEAQNACSSLGTGWSLCASTDICGQSQVFQFLDDQGCACNNSTAACQCGPYNNVYLHVSDFALSLWTRELPTACAGTTSCGESSTEACGAVICCNY